MTYHVPRPATAPMPLFNTAPVAPRVARPDSALFGAFVLEITTPDSTLTVPALDGWQLRVWPVARLGDATLEARPVDAHQNAADLVHALHAHGYGTLGPVRTRRAC
ncbi:hypothetical protein E7T06_03055 [Deinococcus sp. Arct2-2]|uniref:hypothetical protein n=1 Tax=Deinococcus sp. Arct2-2 TaxID=2568653 RepID=UPI0010A58B97|nr:hypothetical protein [Deinococcus sp. Arct2-2]THF71334.1 hypothetical protein E7T06_03055 [Deinococcus sp. Arct2-2]